MTDQELEQHIKDCGDHMLAAHGRGDIAMAREWLVLQNKAITMRSPAKVSELEAERGLAA